MVHLVTRNGLSDESMWHGLVRCHEPEAMPQEGVRMPTQVEGQLTLTFDEPDEENTPPEVQENDPGSTGALIASGQAPPLVDGNHKMVDSHLVAHPPYQRTLSEMWVKKQSLHGWNPSLGYGIVLNKITLDAHQSRNSDGIDPEVVEYARQVDSDYVFEVIIGQHRAYLAKSLGVAQLPALVLDNVNDDGAALLFVHDARTARPLSAYDVHHAALVRHEPRAVYIQSELDSRGIELVASGLTDGKLSCIRALEKVCGPDVTAPDKEVLPWVLDTLQTSFPAIRWPDVMVHGLLLFRRKQIRDSLPVPTSKQLGAEGAKRWKKDKKRFEMEATSVRQTLSSTSPHAAATLWDVLGTAIMARQTKNAFAGLD